MKFVKIRKNLTNIRPYASDNVMLSNGYTSTGFHKSEAMGMWCRPGSARSVYFLVLAIGVAVILINIYQMRALQSEHQKYHALEDDYHGNQGGNQGALGSSTHGNKPKVWIWARNPETGYLRHIYNVFDRLGYQRVYEDTGDWEVLWAHDYPFSKLKENLASLKRHQKVNHWPGSGFITNKVNLATSNLTCLPTAFKMPQMKTQFIKYTASHPDTLWVQKSNTHRGIVIKKVHELDMSAKNTFIQQYVDKPFLIDERRFDIGVYTVVTSVSPLRVYVFEQEWLVRFTPAAYHPFDPDDRAKYVIGDDYTPVWEMPSLKKLYTQLDYNRKDSLMQYLTANGYDADGMWSDIKTAIRDTLVINEDKVAEAAKNIGVTSNFFELVRFDFVMTDTLKVYLMEANMSPNFSSGHFSGNKMMYEQVIFAALSLVGVGRPHAFDMTRGTEDEQNMLVGSKNIYVYPEQCSSDLCEDSCKLMECKLCYNCVPYHDQVMYKHSSLEHHSRRGFRRVVPGVFRSSEAARNWNYEKDTNFSKLNQKNKLMALWFRGKCMQDSYWCS